ncbi:MAG: hypothetical protein V3U76_09345 [Granulosicoccus sp.]
MNRQAFYSCVSALALSLVLGLAFSIFVSGAVYAQDNKGQSIKLGDTDLYPEFRIEYQSQDNAFLEPDNETDATAIIFSPKLNWVASRRLLYVGIDYEGVYGQFSEEPLNFDNHELQLSVNAELSGKQRTSGYLLFSKKHEPLGTGQTRGAAESFDEQIARSGISAGAAYTYGVKNARGNLTAGLKMDNVSYSNLEAITQGDDFTRLTPYGIFSLRVSPDTRILGEARLASLDFDNDGLDRTEYSLLGGADFSPTGKSGGKIRVGMKQSDFSAESVGDRTDLVAEIDLFYLPVSYSRFDLIVERDLDTVSGDANGNDDRQSVTVFTELRWRHDWSRRFFTRAIVSREAIIRECPDDDEVTTAAKLELNLKLRRWLEVGASAAQATREAGSCDGNTPPSELLDYTGFTGGVHIRATL